MVSETESEESLEKKDFTVDKKAEKPHERAKSSYPVEFFQQNIETEQQPPITVVVQGSRQSGKSTIIRSLVKHFTKQKINQTRGAC